MLMMPLHLHVNKKSDYDDDYSSHDFGNFELSFNEEHTCLLH